MCVCTHEPRTSTQRPNAGIRGKRRWKEESTFHHTEPEREEEEEDLFVFNDTSEGPRAPAVKPGRVTQILNKSRTSTQRPNAGIR